SQTCISLSGIRAHVDATGGAESGMCSEDEPEKLTRSAVSGRGRLVRRGGRLALRHRPAREKGPQPFEALRQVSLVPVAGRRVVAGAHDLLGEVLLLGDPERRIVRVLVSLAV